MSATDVHEGFWPNVAGPSAQPAAIEAGAEPIALEAPPQPMALEAAPTIAALEAGSAPDETVAEPDQASVVESSPTPLEAAVAAADEQAEAVAAEDDAGVADASFTAAIALEAPTTDEPAAEAPALEELVAEEAPVATIALGAPEPIEVAEPVADVSPAEATTAEAAPIIEATPIAEAAPITAPIATDVISDLANELDEEQRMALEDVIDLNDFGADPIETGIETAQLHHLPIVEHATLGGGNLDAVRATQPRTLAAHRELEAAVMTGTDTLTEFDRTLIGLIVAIENRSGYWQVHLRRRLERWCPANEIDAIAQDWTRTGLAVRERAMLAFTVKLTLVPGQMSEQDAQLLGNVGFDERDLLDIVDVVAYWGFATRVAEGLGVFVEPGFADHYEPA